MRSGIACWPPLQRSAKITLVDGGGGGGCVPDGERKALGYHELYLSFSLSFSTDPILSSSFGIGIIYVYARSCLCQRRLYSCVALFASVYAYTLWRERGCKLGRCNVDLHYWISPSIKLSLGWQFIYRLFGSVLWLHIRRVYAFQQQQQQQLCRLYSLEVSARLRTRRYSRLNTLFCARKNSGNFKRIE